MSTKSKQTKKPGRRDLAEAMENICMSLALYHGAKGSVAEAYVNSELDRMAESIFKSLTPDGMLRLQANLGALLQQEAEKAEAAEKTEMN